MKDIKDYLHFYIGCECQVSTEYGVQGPPHTFIGSLHGIYYDRWNTDGMELSLQLLTEHGGRWTYRADQVNLILRPLSDITKEEFHEYGRLGDGDFNVEYDRNDEWRFTKMEAKAVKYLIEKQFDVFGLIEAGLAIDKTKM